MTENTAHGDLKFSGKDIVLAGGLREDDLHIVEHCLNRFFVRASHFPQGAVTAQVSVKDRESAQQKTTLECTVRGLPTMVATSEEENLKDALHQVCDRMVTQINREVGKHNDHHAH